VNTWQGRCYSDGIPDEVPAKIAAANRAPSWKSIAMAILKNDMHLRSLGFDMDESELCKALRQEQKRSKERQLSMQFTRMIL
jgi:predicted phosphoadenosine phosphosulfate sulfurtransferase